MSWLEKLLPPKIQQTDPSERRSVPEGLWIKCPACETVLYKTDLEQNLNVCPKCSHHHRIGARARLDAFLDGEGRYDIGQEVVPVDALKFKDSKKYPERLKEALENTGETDALVVMGGASWAARCTAFRSWSPALNSSSWAARWARWSASASCAASKPPANRRPRSSASPPPAARACRRVW
jgi:acetyl-CoA carboxylase beta subunit